MGDRPERQERSEEPEGSVTMVSEDVGNPRRSTVDDAQDTDHLARLADPEVLENVRALEALDPGGGPWR